MDEVFEVTSLDRISTEEMLADARESVQDINLCFAALEAGIDEVHGKLVFERLDGKLKILRRIGAELAWRIEQGRQIEERIIS